jgi:hypothetical protein
MHLREGAKIASVDRTIKKDESEEESADIQEITKRRNKRFFEGTDNNNQEE